MRQIPDLQLARAAAGGLAEKRPTDVKSEALALESLDGETIRALTPSISDTGVVETPAAGSS